MHINAKPGGELTLASDPSVKLVPHADFANFWNQVRSEQAIASTAADVSPASLVSATNWSTVKFSHNIMRLPVILNAEYTPNGKMYTFCRTARWDIVLMERWDYLTEFVRLARTLRLSSVPPLSYDWIGAFQDRLKSEEDPEELKRSRTLARMYEEEAFLKRQNKPPDTMELMVWFCLVHCRDWYGWNVGE